MQRKHQPVTLTCHECELAVTVNNLNVGQKAHCSRCGFVLLRYPHNMIDSILAFSLTAIIFLLLSLPFEFLLFKSNGLENSMSLFMSFQILVENDYWFLALIELITIYITPIFLLCTLLYLFIPLKKERYPANGHQVMKYLFLVLPWSMVEIFLVGAFVSLIKLVSLADVILGPSFYAFLFFSIAMTATVLYIDKQALLNMLDYAQSISNEENLNESEQKSSENKSLSLLENEQRVNDLSDQEKLSIQKTWALILTSIILFIPANVLPIMNTRLLGQDDPSTILGGVILLWELGSIPIAFVIFIASIIVPVAKILALIWLNYSVQTNSVRFRRERIKLYRLAEFVGRWSMVDVFVVIILASLIQLGNTMTIYPGAATISFSGVVIVTMLAAMSFEPKLIWKSNILKSE
ncbi:MAG: PqiA/YebS family transporter subunit [Kangiellaceae bacterium]